MANNTHSTSSGLAILSEQLGRQVLNACMSNDTSRVEALVSGSDPEQWYHVLLAAAYSSALDVASYSMTRANKYDMIASAVWWCARVEDSDDAYQFLVNSGFVGVDYYLERCGTMLGIVVIHRTACRHNLVKFLLEKGATPNVTVDLTCHKTILTSAAGRADPEILGLLLDHGARLNDRGALAWAAETGKLENVKFLLARGADVDEMGVVRDDRRSLEKIGTALHKAVEKGHIAIAETLIQAGANVNLEDAKGRTAAGIAREKGLGADLLLSLQRQGEKSRSD